MKSLLSSVAFAGAVALGGAAQAELPSMKIGRGAAVAASTTFYGTSASHTDVLKTDVAPEIKALARALKNDPDLIYAYVKNTIEITPLFGLKKGALGAYLDGHGTAFDQAQLMLDLLEAAGISGATVEIGTLQLSAAQFEDWFGVADADMARDLLAFGGIPADVSGSGSSFTVTMMHAWVKAGGVTYDPGYKKHHWYTGADLGAASGYSRFNFTSAASGSTGVDNTTGTSVSYMENVSPSGIDSNLLTQANNLLSDLKTNHVGESLDEIVGGGVILDDVKGAGGWDLVGTRSTSITGASDVPDQFRTTLRLCTHRGYSDVCTDTIDDPINVTFYVDEIYGRKLEIVPDLTQGHMRSYDITDFNARLMLDQQTVAIAGQNSIHSTTGETPGGRLNWTLELEVNHPYAADSGAYMDSTIQTQFDVVTTANITHGWGHVGGELLNKWSKEYGEDTQSGFMRTVSCGEDLSLCPPHQLSQQENTKAKLGAAWLAQFSQAADMLGKLSGGQVLHHHTVGITYSETQIGTETHSEDASRKHYTAGDQVIRMDLSTALSAPHATDIESNALVQVAAAVASTLEGSVFEQQLDAVDTTSTAKRFAWAEEVIPTQARYLKLEPGIADADVETLVLRTDNDFSTCPPASFNVSAGDYGSVRMRDYLASTYSVYGVNDEFLGPGYKCGPTEKVKASSWGDSVTFNIQTPSLQRGAAFIALKKDAGGNITDIAHVVTTREGAYKGGSGAVDNDNKEQFDPAKAADLLKDEFEDKSVVHGVDLASGNATWSSGTVLSVGNGGFPYELSLELKIQNGVVVPPVTPGTETTRHWNYGDISKQILAGNMRSEATMSGSGMEAMGVSHPWNAVGTIVAMQTAYDIALKGTTEDAVTVGADFEEVMLLPFINDWWSRQLSDNVISVSSPSGGYQFVRLPDGTFNAPLGSLATLSKSGSRVAERLTKAGGGICTSPTICSQTRRWNYGSIDLTVTTPNKETLFFDAVTYLTNDDTAITSHKHLLKNLHTASGFGVDFTYDIGTYDHGIRLSQVANDFGRTLNWNYDASFPFEVASVDDGNGHSVTFTTSSQNMLNREGFTAPDGNFYGFESASMPAGARPSPGFQLGEVYLPDSTSAALSYSYDQEHRVTEVRDAEAVLNNRNPYEFFIAPGFRGERMDPAGNSYSAWYGKAAYRDILDGDTPGTNEILVPYGEFIDEVGRVVRTEFDTLGRVAARQYPEGNRQEFDYDALNNVVEMRKVAKDWSETLTATAAYGNTNFPNKPTQVVDFRGFATDITYDNTTGNVTEAKRPAVIDPDTSTSKRPTFTYAYNTDGQLVRVIDAEDMVTVNDYDSLTGNLTSTVVDCGNPAATTTATCSGGLMLKTSFEYDLVGNQKLVNGPRTDVSDTTTTLYDAMRRAYKVTDPYGTYTQTWFDEVGRPKKVKTFDINNVFLTGSRKTYTATGQVENAYSAECFTATGDLDLASDACAITNTVYTDLDQPEYVTDGEGRVVKTDYLADGKVARVHKAWGTADAIVYQEYGYVPDGGDITAFNGQPVWVQDANGNRTAYEYDLYGRLEKTIFPAKAVADVGTVNSADYESYAYDANGNMTQKRTRRGDYIYSTYDVLNRLTQKQVMRGGVTSENQVNYTYDLMGRDYSIDQVGGTIPTSGGDVVIPAWTLSYTYDNAGRQLTEDQGGRVVTVEHDQAGNRTSLTYVGSTNNNVAEKKLTFTYDALNRLKTVVDGATTLATYGYDDLSRKASLTFDGGAATTYTYFQDSALESLTHNFAEPAEGTHDVIFGYTYNKVNQITTRSQTNNLYAFSYFKPADPIVDKTTGYVPNGLNQYDAVDGVALSYDGSGNLITTGTGVDTWTFTYDVENRLVRAEENVSNGTVATYVYGPKGRRISKSVYLDGTSSPTTTSYLYEGDEPIADFNSSGGLLRRYAHGANVDERLVYWEYKDTDGSPLAQQYYAANHQGSIIAMVDGTGARQKIFTYDSYGKPGEASDGQPFRYTGRRYDAETGLYYYRARYYSADMGRFLQTDPIGYEDNMNLYGYTGNDPMNKTDPSGQKVVCTPTDDPDIFDCVEDNSEGMEEVTVDGNEDKPVDLRIRDFLNNLFKGMNPKKTEEEEKLRIETLEKLKVRDPQEAADQRCENAAVMMGVGGALNGPKGTAKTAATQNTSETVKDLGKEALKKAGPVRAAGYAGGYAAVVGYLSYEYNDCSATHTSGN